MKNSFFYAGALALTVMMASCGSSTDSKKVADNANDAKIDSAKTADTTAAPASPMVDMKPDAKFAVMVADIGMLEVQLGKLAQEKGINAKVKNFGAMMVKDHTAANAELTSTAKEKNITLPASLSDDSQKKLADLSAKTGSDFDKAYTDAMVDGHKKTIDAFKDEADKGTDPQLMAWAKNKIPTLQHHLMMAEEAKKACEKAAK